jgi:hypothetical protein
MRTNHIFTTILLVVIFILVASNATNAQATDLGILPVGHEQIARSYVCSRSILACEGMTATSAERVYGGLFNRYVYSQTHLGRIVGTFDYLLSAGLWIVLDGEGLRSASYEYIDQIIELVTGDVMAGELAQELMRQAGI